MSNKEFYLEFSYVWSQKWFYPGLGSSQEAEYTFIVLYNIN